MCGNYKFFSNSVVTTIGIVFKDFSLSFLYSPWVKKKFKYNFNSQSDNFMVSEKKKREHIYLAVFLSVKRKFYI